MCDRTVVLKVVFAVGLISINGCPIQGAPKLKLNELQKINRDNKIEKRFPTRFKYKNFETDESVYLRVKC